MALRTRTDLIVLHTTATLPHQDFGAKDIDRMHRARGWKMIGYAAVATMAGVLEMGRGFDEIGAHVEGWNSRAPGIAYVGGLDRNGKPANTLNAKQDDLLVRTVRDLQKRWPKAGVCGHRDLSPDLDRDGIIEPHEWMKACPCFDVIPWARERGLLAANIKGVWANDNSPIIDPKVDAPDARDAWLQKLLARAGFAFGPIDGIVGPRTADAVRAYQRWSGLPESGQFDQATVALLRARFDQKAA